MERPCTREVFTISKYNIQKEINVTSVVGKTRFSDNEIFLFYWGIHPKESVMDLPIFLKIEIKAVGNALHPTMSTDYDYNEMSPEQQKSWDCCKELYNAMMDSMIILEQAFKHGAFDDHE